MSPQPIAIVSGVLVGFGVAIWFVSGWSARGPKSRFTLLAAGVVIAICISLVVYALFFAQPLPVRSGWRIAPFIQPFLVPLFALFPFAVCISAAQFLSRISGSFTVSRMSSAVAGIGAGVVTPFALLAAGCGLAGACL